MNLSVSSNNMAFYRESLFDIKILFAYILAEMNIVRKSSDEPLEIHIFYH